MATTTHGLEVYNSTGGLVYSSADVTWNQVDYFSVNALTGTSYSKTYSFLANAGKEVKILQILVNAPPTDRRALAHTTSFNSSTGVVTISGGSESAFILVLMR